MKTASSERNETKAAWSRSAIVFANAVSALRTCSFSSAFVSARAVLAAKTPSMTAKVIRFIAVYLVTPERRRISHAARRGERGPYNRATTEVEHETTDLRRAVRRESSRLRRGLHDPGRPLRDVAAVPARESRDRRAGG